MAWPQPGYRPGSMHQRRLDLHQVGIGTVIWALGYDYDFAWIKCPVPDGKGAPSHQRGVTEVRGLYFLGLPRLHKVKSAFLWGVGEDAAHIADQILDRT
jgi:putative flavoprotein involved in K+ transport